MAKSERVEGGYLLRGWRLSQIVKSKPMSQRAAGEIFGTTQATWSRWEKGIWRPEAYERAAVRIVCGIPESAWFTRAEKATLVRLAKKHLVVQDQPISASELSALTSKKPAAARRAGDAL
jgi:transcriptional regulator with XRE-family HTH domain